MLGRRNSMRDSKKSIYIKAYVTETKVSEYWYNTDYQTADEIQEVMMTASFIEDCPNWEFIDDEITDSEMDMKLEIA
tara:strand:+ start:417 stop:647 length:231 start_codon:yes stop_codon:yes gene_type:complete